MPVLAKPSDPSGNQFESQCLVIFERHFEADDANFYGRSGVGQNGIDIRLTSYKTGKREQVVVQCKDTQALYWSDFGEAFKQALRTFAPRTAHDPDLFYVIATTALGVDTADIDSKAAFAKQALHAEDPSIDLSRVRHEVFAWKRIQLLVDHDPRLRGVFCRTPRQADGQTSKQLNDLGRRVAQSKAARCLRSAQGALQTYREAALPSDHDDYQWAPTALLDDLLDVFLLAGDFEQVSKLLDAALGADPLEARYLLAHLRARRVLTAVRKDNRPPEWPPKPRAPLRPVPAEVAFNAHDLLTALGTLDEQLALALWIVSYATDPVLADTSLQRARSLVALGWPVDTEPLQAAQRYTITHQGYLCREGKAEPQPAKVSDSGHLASSLATAYTYIRLVHACRRGYPQTVAAEAAHGGWPEVIHELTGGDVTSFFSSLDWLCRSLMKRYFPRVYAEGRGREFDWPVGDEFRSPLAPALKDSRYVCTSEFLLRECADRLVDRRFAELAGAGFLNNGVTLLTTHLSLERIAQVQGMQQIVLPHAGVHRSHVESMLGELDKVLSSVVRGEVDERGTIDGRIASYPCYYEFPLEQRAPLDANIELCLDKKADFIAASHWEFSRAEARLLMSRRRLQYWAPPWTGTAFRDRPF